MKLFTTSGVGIKAFAKLKWLRTRFCSTLAKFRLNKWPLVTELMSRKRKKNSSSCVCQSFLQRRIRKIHVIIVQWWHWNVPKRGILLREFLLSKPYIFCILFFDVVFTVAVVKVVVMSPLVLPAITNESTHKRLRKDIQVNSIPWYHLSWLMVVCFNHHYRSGWCMVHMDRLDRVLWSLWRWRTNTIPRV